MTCLHRRGALTMLGAATIVGCFGDTTDTDAGDAGADDASGEGDPCASTAGKRVGAGTDFATGTWKRVGQLIVAQDANGYFAFSAICTHQGCVVDPPSSNGSTFCPCHGSRFDGNGAVIVGPANRPLQHYAVALCGGDVYVDTQTPVSASARTPEAP